MFSTEDVGSGHHRLVVTRRAHDALDKRYSNHTNRSRQCKPLLLAEVRAGASVSHRALSLHSSRCRKSLHAGQDLCVSGSRFLDESSLSVLPACKTAARV